MDEFMTGICAEHGVRSVGINMWGQEHHERFTVYLHWEVGHCVSGDGKTVDEALACAVAELKSLRSPDTSARAEGRHP